MSDWWEEVARRQEEQEQQEEKEVFQRKEQETFWWEEVAGRQEEEEVVQLFFWENCDGIYDNDGDLLITSLMMVGIECLRESVYMSHFLGEDILIEVLEKMD